MKPMRKTLRSAISLMIVCSVLCSLCSIHFAGAVDERQLQKERFDALPEDAIVCYLRGQPVYKYEINENGPHYQADPGD